MSDRRWLLAPLAAAALAHGPALAGGLLDADRLLLVRNPDVHTFAGLGAMLSAGEPILRAAALSSRDRCPLGILSTWLGWQWFRASPAAQHALGVGALMAMVVAVASLLEALRAPRMLSAVALLALALHPVTADLTGPILGRDALLAAWVALFAARRTVDAGAPRAAAWSAGASLAAGLLAPGWGLAGLIPAAVVADRRARHAALGAAAIAAAAALALTRDLTLSPLSGASALMVAWLPSTRPFAIATVEASEIAVVVPALVAAGILGASRALRERDAALLRAGAAAMIASLLAAAVATREGTAVAAPGLALHLGVVLSLAGLAGAVAEAKLAALRPWMLLAFAIPAAITASRARAWAGEDGVLAAIVARDPEDPEARLAEARLALRRGSLDDAAPFCLQYGAARPTTFRADGCVAALAVARGDEQAAVLLLQRWAARFDDKRALRQAVLEIADAQPDPRFGAAFQRATGFNMPARRPGEAR